MNSKIIQTAYFSFDGRGPILERWLSDADLQLPDSSTGYAPPTGHIVGAQYTYFPENDLENPKTGWIIFDGLQVLQFVPHEVHSYWHLEHRTGRTTGVWEIEDSEWLKTFRPRHLSTSKHFILEFYDDLLEVICTDLIFDEGEFDIEKVAEEKGRFAFVYLRKAESLRKQGKVEEAIAHYQKYIDKTTDSPRDVEVTRRTMEVIKRDRK